MDQLGPLVTLDARLPAADERGLREKQVLPRAAFFDDESPLM
ncbi:hypothetical protein [Pseudokineococcus sp. 1T1Z-3]